MKTTCNPQLWLLFAAASLSASTSSRADTIMVAQAGPYTTIQAAINAATDGDTILVEAGTYNEAPIVSKRLSIIGAGSDATTGTVITASEATAGGSTGGAIQLMASGLSTAEPVLLQGLRILPSGISGIAVGFFATDIAPGSVVEHVKLDDVAVVGNHTAPCTEQERGLGVGQLSTLRDLVVTGCSFDNLNYGWYLMKNTTVGNVSTVEDVSVSNTTFSNNTNKGLYAEKLSSASFTDCTVDGNGDSSAAFGACSYFLPYLAGFDINLKAGAYGNLAFSGCTFTNNGLGAKEGVGLTVKARGTGADSGYFANPATVDGVIIDNCTISGNERGVRFGEPGKGNTTPVNVTVTGSSIAGNLKTYAGTDGSDYGDVVNANSVETAGIPAGAAQWSVSSGSSLQAAVNAASPGDTILVANGTYTLPSALNITKALSLVGESEAGVVIDASGNGTGYGISVEANNVTLRNFTLLPPVIPANLGHSNGGGFAIHASYNHAPPISPYANLTLADITIENGNRAAFDVHGYDGATLENLTARNCAYGNGIQISGCTDVNITGCTTSGNAWGGIAFYVSSYLGRACSAITYDMAANSISEPVLVEDEVGLVNSVDVGNGTYLIENVYAPGTAGMKMYTTGDLAAASLIAVGLNSKYSNTASTLEDLGSGGAIVANGMSIQVAIDAATAGDVISVLAGSYVEDIVVGKSVDLRGPNYGVAGDDARVPEAVVMPATSAISSGELMHVTADAVSIDGFLLDGDNPALTSGFLGTNGADLDAAEGITVYVDGVDSLNVRHNIIRNFSYFGVTLFGASYSAPATSGHLVSENLIQDLGTYDAASGIDKWGGAVLLYNNQYARVEDNVMSNVRLGVQTGNFHSANPGTADYQVIDGNTIQARRIGIFHNLHSGSPSSYTLSNNSITGLANPNESMVKGILLASLSVPSLSLNNVIDMTSVTTLPSLGYEVWNVKNTTPATITGGSVTGASTGLFVNNYDGYNSNAGDGGNATVSGLAIAPNPSGTGIRVFDNPASTHVGVNLAIGSGVTVSGGTNGLLVENPNASVSSVGNLALAGQNGNFIELISNAGNIDATAMTFDGNTGTGMSLGELFATEAKLVHQLDNPALGLVTWVAGWNPVWVVIDDVQHSNNLSIPAGTTVIITNTGELSVDLLEIADGGTLQVDGGSLDLGDGSVISGSFTIFNSFGSWDINGDTTFNIGQSLALISEIHVAGGKTVTVNGGGELILDGCIMDSQTPGTPYNFTAEADGLLTMARCVVTDANIDINTTLAGNLRSRIFDSSFTTSDIEAAAAGKVYHNLFDSATDTASNTDATTAFAAIDGWANVTDAASLQNRFSLDFAAPSDASRTLDAGGNLFVQPADAVVMKMDVSALGANTITAAEALLGYNSGMLMLAGSPTRVTPIGDWEVIAETAPVPSGLGIVDSALGLQLDAGEEGISADSQVAEVTFTAGNPGLTLGFFRVQTDRQFNPDGTLVRDTRLTKSTAGLPSLLAAFTANTGELVIDNELPAIAEASVDATQVQANSASPVDVLDAIPATPPGYVFRNGNPVILTFSATDAGLAGLDAPDATADLALTADNGTTTLGSADYTVSAVEAAGVVTYTVTLDVPVTATNGVYAVTATVRDRSGNVSPLAALGSFQIDNELLATVELQGYNGGARDVLFTATDSLGTVLTSWTKSVTFTGAVGTVPLETVPAGTVAISAKTAWNLRGKLPVSFSTEGVSAVSLTGANLLPGGDLTGDNVVNTLDYSVLRYHWLTADPAADINGDAVVNIADYNLLKGNFYTIGDPQ